MKEISLHLLDIIQNSVSAGAGRISISLSCKKREDILAITIEDNGKGMDDELLKRVADPFATTRTTRKVGLGIPLFKAAAEDAEGYFKISSRLGVGTIVEAGFKISSIDRLPLGDLAGIVTDMIMSNPEIDYVLLLENRKRAFQVSTDEIKSRLGEVPINEYHVLEWIREYLNGGIREIFGGVLNEVDS